MTLDVGPWAVIQRGALERSVRYWEGAGLDHVQWNAKTCR